MRLVVHHEDGMFWTEVEPGCFASGETVDDLLDAVAEAQRQTHSPTGG